MCCVSSHVCSVGIGVHVTVILSVSVYHVNSQADTDWWKPVLYEMGDQDWQLSNALVTKQVWNARLAYHILIDRRFYLSGFQVQL